jgi:hypothetical protein
MRAGVQLSRAERSSDQTCTVAASFPPCTLDACTQALALVVSKIEESEMILKLIGTHIAVMLCYWAK